MPLGFSAAGLASGIKASGTPDLALIAADPVRPVSAAAVFTSSLAAAAPVRLSRENLRASGGMAGAVIMNSGCANAATGAEGVAAAEAMVAATARALGLRFEHVLVCSTGVIGQQLPVELLKDAIPEAVARRASSEEAMSAAARAIMTTDTREKHASALLPSGARVRAIGKGAAMIAPDMATMLAVLMTDAPASPHELDVALRSAVARSFNELSIDGCTSTNDTVIALASGAAAESPNAPPADGGAALCAAFTTVCRDLARQIAADAEGGTKVVRVVVTGAADDESARRAARTVADSNLVKVSWYGADPNWGRVVAALGAAGITFDQGLVEVAYGEHVVCRGGSLAEHDSQRVAAYLAGEEIELRCDLGLGPGSGEVLSADLTHGYVDENMGLS